MAKSEAMKKRDSSSAKATADRYKRGGKKMKQEVKEGKQSDKVGKVMDEFKEGKLRSGSKKGPKVKNKRQALAIALSEAGVPKKKKKRKK